MSETREHPQIPVLKQQFAEGKIHRREFLRYSTLLGLSATAAYAIVGKVTGESFVQPARAQAKGGNMRIAMRIVEVVDPHTFSWVYDSNVVRQVAEYLTRTGHDNVTRPYLCESWEASDDLKTWNLTMRKGVKWHSGRPFTAEDAAWNIQHCLDPNTGSSVLGLMKGYMMNEAGDAIWDANAIEVVDESTLRLNLKVPQVAVPEHLFHYPFHILDPEEGGKFGPGSNGTGAFDLVEHEVGIKSVLRARDDYWGEGPHLDQITYIDLGDDPSAAVGAMASKQVDVIYQGDISQLDIFQAIPGSIIHSADTAQTGVARVQTDRDLFKDPRVRLAMRLAVDPPRVLEIAHRGLGKPAEHHHVCPIHPDYFPLPEMKRDVAKAKALLEEAGLSGGLETEIACKKDPPWELNAVQAMVEQWKLHGAGAGLSLGRAVERIPLRQSRVRRQADPGRGHPRHRGTQARHEGARGDHATGRADHPAAVALGLPGGHRTGQGHRHAPDLLHLRRTALSRKLRARFARPDRRGPFGPLLFLSQALTQRPLAR